MLSQFQAPRYVHSIERVVKTVLNGEQPVLAAASLKKKTNQACLEQLKKTTKNLSQNNRFPHSV
jgi:hypothetical protein